jgi:single-stranded DNA-binding protein
MRGENYFQFLGNLVKEPEVRENVTVIRIVVNREYSSNGKRIKQSDNFAVFFYGALAQYTAEMLHTGDGVFVKGRIEHNSIYGDDGLPHSSYKFRAEHFSIVHRAVCDRIAAE